MVLVNLTPHEVKVLDRKRSRVQPGGLAKPADVWVAAVIPPSGQVARVTVDHEDGGIVSYYGANLPLRIARYGDVTGLPDPEPDTLYIVSAVVREALRGKRTDVISPGGLVRDSTNPSAILGCLWFDANDGCVTPLEKENL